MVHKYQHDLCDFEGCESPWDYQILRRKDSRSFQYCSEHYFEVFEQDKEEAERLRA